MAGPNGTNGSNGSAPKIGTDTVKAGLAQMLKGGVIVSNTRIVTMIYFFYFIGILFEHLLQTFVARFIQNGTT